jgi:hypothetical protein
MKRLVGKLLNLLLGEQCRLCGKRGGVKSKPMVRGYDFGAGRNVAAYGSHCYKCNRIHWEIPTDEWLQSQPATVRTTRQMLGVE